MALANMNMRLTVVVLMLASSLNAMCCSSHVVTLTDANFDDLTESGAWLLDFYAPWCAHCQKLAPVLDEVSKSVEDTLNIGKVDCTVQTALADRFEIRSYPTLKFQREGYIRPYIGGREQEDFLKFADSIKGDPVTSLGSVKEFASHEVSFVLVSVDGKAPAMSGFRKAAGQLQGIVGFFDTQDSDLVEALGVEVLPSIVRISEGSENIVFQTAGQNKDDIVTWIHSKKHPLLPELGAHNFADLTSSGPLVILVINSNDQLEEDIQKNKESARGLARAFSSDFTFSWIDGVLWTKWISNFGLNQDALPGVLVFDHGNEVFITRSNANSVLDDELVGMAFLKDVVDNKIDWKTFNSWNPGYYIRRGFKFLEKNISAEYLLPLGIVGALAFLILLAMIFYAIDARINASAVDMQTRRSSKKTL